MPKKSTAKSAPARSESSTPKTVTKRASSATKAKATTTAAPPAKTKKTPSGTTAKRTTGTARPARSRMASDAAVPFSEDAVRLEAWLVFEERLATGRSGDHLTDWAEAEARLTTATTVTHQA